MSRTTPLQRTMDLARRKGWRIAKTEQWLYWARPACDHCARPQAHRTRSGNRVDLFGFADAVMIKKRPKPKPGTKPILLKARKPFRLGEGTVYVQACVSDDIAVHLAKLRGKLTGRIPADPEAHEKAKAKALEIREAVLDCLAAGNRIIIVGWALRGAVGARKLWKPRVIELMLQPDSVIGTLTPRDTLA